MQAYLENLHVYQSVKREEIVFMLERETILQTLNKANISDKKYVICPYGELGKYADEQIRVNMNLTPAYYLDNYTYLYTITKEFFHLMRIPVKIIKISSI